MIRQFFDPRRDVAFAQLLCILVVVSITRSPPLTSLFELLLILVCIFGSNVRKLLKESWADWRVKLLLAFFLWIGLAMLWSSAPWAERIDKWWSWRKLLYLPVALAVFRFEPAKKALLVVFVFVCAVYMVLSWLGYFGWIELWTTPNWVLRNHSTQGIFFALASVISISLVIRGSLPFWGRLALIFCLLGFIANILFILTGRTSYLSLLVMSSVFVFFSTGRLRWLLSGITIFVISVGLYFSPTANQRISMAVDNATHAFDEERAFSSLGVRMLFWKNAAEIIVENPVLGVGTASFRAAFESKLDDESGWRRDESTDDPHNQYLLIASEFGLVGLGMFMLLLASLLFPSRIGLFEILGLVLVLSYAVNGLANGHFGGFTEGRLIWIFAGAMLAGSRFSIEARRLAR